MKQNHQKAVLWTSLVLYAVITIVYGVGYLFFPETLVEMSGGEPIPSGWLRWSGGVLIALGIGSFLVMGNFEHQGNMVFTFALGTLFCGLALLYNLLFDVVGSKLFTAVPTVVVLADSVLLWWAWCGSSEVLKRPGAKGNTIQPPEPQ